LAEISRLEFSVPHCFISLYDLFLESEIRAAHLRDSRGRYYRQASPGMSVCLQARIWEFGNVSVLREDLTHTDSSGRFSFVASTHVLEILQSWEGYTIKVTDPKKKDYFPQPGGGFAFLTYDERQVTPKDGTLFYFPVAMVEQLGWHRAVPFGANRKTIFLVGATIPLIPVLQSSEQCSSARDSSVVGICVGLNGSTEAYRLRRGKPESDSPAH
jgi:hypothetical protein